MGTDNWGSVLRSIAELHNPQRCTQLCDVQHKAYTMWVGRAQVTQVQQVGTEAKLDTSDEFEQATKVHNRLTPYGVVLHRLGSCRQAQKQG